MANLLEVFLYPFIWRPKGQEQVPTSPFYSHSDVKAAVEEFVDPAGEAITIPEEYTIDPTEWAAVPLTLVEYPKEDGLGFVYASLSLTPQVIIVAFITLILFRRDLWTMTFFAGLMFDEFLNKVLKHILKHPRPLERKDSYGKYGMPSSHAQFMGFFTVYVILFIFLRQKQTYRDKLTKLFRKMLVATLVIVNIIVCLSRVYLSYHTLNQVLVGQLIGISLGALMFFGVHIYLVPLFPTIVSWKFSEYLLIRDTNFIPNILLFEYVVIRQETRARLRQTLNKKSN